METVPAIGLSDNYSMHKTECKQMNTLHDNQPLLPLISLLVGYPPQGQIPHQDPQVQVIHLILQLIVHHGVVSHLSCAKLAVYVPNWQVHKTPMSMCKAIKVYYPVC